MKESANHSDSIGKPSVAQQPTLHQRFKRCTVGIAFLLFLLQGGAVAQTDVSIEFYGTIQSANSAGVVVNGQIIDVRGALVNLPLTTDTSVRVQATILADGNLVARQIDGVPGGVIPGLVEINGTVTSFAPPLLSVSGQTIDVTGAEISGSIGIGQLVRVFAVAVSPGVWQARFVDAADNVPEPISTDEVLVLPIATEEVPEPAFTPEVGDEDDDDSGEDSDDNDDSGDDSGGGDSNSHGDSPGRDPWTGIRKPGLPGHGP